MSEAGKTLCKIGKRVVVEFLAHSPSFSQQIYWHFLVLGPLWACVSRCEHQEGPGSSYNLCESLTFNDVGLSRMLGSVRDVMGLWMSGVCQSRLGSTMQGQFGSVREV